MSLIGFYFMQLPTPLVVEIEHEFRISLKTFGRGHIHDVVAFPQAVAVTKRFDAAFCGDAGAGKDDEYLFFSFTTIDYFKVNHIEA